MTMQTIRTIKVIKKNDTPIDVAGRRIWKMSLGNTQGWDAYIFDECVQRGYALLGWGGLIDFSDCATRDAVHQRFLGHGEKIGENDYAVTAVTTFIAKVKVGDLIIVTDGNFKFRAIGEVTGDYKCILREEQGDEYGQCRKVNWLRVYSPSLPHDRLMNNQFSQRSIYELKTPAINMERLISLLG